MRRPEWAPAVFIVLAVLGFSRLSPHFLDIQYLLENSTLYMETGLLALGMTFVIATGNIDLSVGSNLVLTACLSAKLVSAGWSIPLVVVFALCFGGLLGAANGLLIAKLKLPSFLVTLATMAAYRGAAQAILGPSSVALPPSFVGADRITLTWLPVPLIVFLVAAAITGLLLHKTVFGRWALALGTNERASRYSGVPIDRVKVAVFALTGLMAGLGALLLDSRLGVARNDLANGIELDVITVVVVGGTAITGGRASMLGSVLALFLIGILKSGMGVADVKAEYQLTVIGVLLIAAALASNGAKPLMHIMRNLRRSSATSGAEN